MPNAMTALPNVYDFDKTIIYPDGGFTFCGYCFRRHPELLRFFPRIAVELVRFAYNATHQKPVKGEYYGFLRGLPSWRDEVQQFWDIHADKLLKPWYLAQLRPDDIIISCSPDFLLQPLCDKLGVRLLATQVDTQTGKLIGDGCFGKEKVRRLHEAFGSAQIGEFYSDSLSDHHLARLAQKAFLVKGDQRLPWPES